MFSVFDCPQACRSNALSVTYLVHACAMLKECGAGIVDRIVHRLITAITQ